jgi:hypothetical protein
LAAGAHITVDLSLEVGQTSETVKVTATGQTINQTSAEIASTIQTRTVLNLALNERNYVQLSTLIPGAPVSQGNFDQTSFTTGQVINASVMNGQRGDGNLWTVDGAFNMDGGSNGSQVNNVGIDFVQEVNIQTSNYGAEYGRSNATSVNVVTKSGGDQWHGGAFEYVRNNVFDARNALQASGGNTAAQIVPELRFNDFGGDVGGPVIKHKLFIFFGMEAKRLVLPADGTVTDLVPSPAELIGNFADTGETLQAKGTVANSCIGSYNGTAVFVASSTGTGNAINPSCITGAGQAIAKVYTLLDTPGATPYSASSVTYSNPATSTPNATFTPSTPQDWEEDLVRADYHPTQNHSMYFRSIHDHLLLIDPFGTFGPSHGSALPTSPSARNRPGYDFQLADVWTANSHLVNEAKLNVVWNKQRIPVTGNLWQEATYGFTNGTGGNYQEPFGNVGPYPTHPEHQWRNLLQEQLPSGNLRALQLSTGSDGGHLSNGQSHVLLAQPYLPVWRALRQKSQGPEFPATVARGQRHLQFCQPQHDRRSVRRCAVGRLQRLHSAFRRSRWPLSVQRLRRVRSRLLESHA